LSYPERPFRGAKEPHAVLLTLALKKQLTVFFK